MSRRISILFLYIWSALILQLTAVSTPLTPGMNREFFDQHYQKKMRDLDGVESDDSATLASSVATNDRSAINTNSSPSLPSSGKHPFRKTAAKNMLAGWGVIQVLSILANAIKRLVPLAIQPIVQKDLQPTQIAVCALWCAYMIYTEGYQTFQLKFSPLVVKRAFGLSNNPSIMNCLLAGPYSMGLFGATRKRMLVSWSVTLGVFAIVKVVKKLPYPWRSIVDAGVVLGLTYGAITMCIQAARGMFGYIPDVDECLPIRKEVESAKI